MLDSTPPASASDEDREDEALFRRELLKLGDDDIPRLHGMREMFEQTSDALVEKFYEHLESFPQTARFLKDKAMVARLKELQRQHFMSLFTAEWDEAYAARRQDVGKAHARKGIEPQYFLAGYFLYLEHCFRELAPDGDGQLDSMLSLLKAVFLDIGLALDAYFAQQTNDLHTALEMYWQANNELRHFASLASHDLKTPLATMANYCEEALDEYQDELPQGARELIQAARDRSWRMGNMIDELLSNANRPEADQVEEVSSEEPLREAVERLQPVLDERGIELSLPPSFPFVWGDRIRLREVFYNLLANAAKFIDKNPGRIAILVELDDSRCRFCVSDNGPGIPPEELDRVFAPFRRLPQHRDRPGSGLGLYFSKNMVEQQQGRIWVESTPGQGSRFYVELRRA